MKPVARSTVIFLALVALAHLLRLVLQVEVVAGGVRIPLWRSGLACVVTGGLAILLWRESQWYPSRGAPGITTRSGRRS